MNLAFFDVDYTVYEGLTTVQFFYAFAERFGRQDLIVERKQMEAEIEAGTIDHHRLTQWSMSLSGQVVAEHSVEEVQHTVNQVIATEGKFFPWVKPLFSYLRQKKFSLYLISASIEPMIAEIAQALEVEHYFATILEVKDGYYTGERANIHNGASKFEALNTIISGITEDNNVIAFGDSDGDIEMLEAADLGFVVNPVEFSEGILSAARKHKWPVLRHETALEQVKQALKSEFSIT